MKELMKKLMPENHETIDDEPPKRKATCYQNDRGADPNTA